LPQKNLALIAVVSSSGTTKWTQLNCYSTKGCMPFHILKSGITGPNLTTFTEK